MSQNSNLNKFKRKKTQQQPSELKTEQKKTFENNILSEKFQKIFPLIIILLTIIAFANSINSDFLNWDDDRYVTGNPYLNFSPANIKYFLTNFYFVMYIPLTMFSYMIDYAIAGIDKPWIYHLHNLTLHTANAVLIYFFIKKLFANYSQKELIAFLSAVFFAVHPLHVESVAWIAERKDVLYTFFFMLSLIFYLNYTEKQKLKFILFSFLFFVLSLLAKTQAVVLPIILLLIDYFNGKLLKSTTDLKNFLTFKDKEQWNLILQKIPFFALSLIFAFIAIKASGTTEPFASGMVHKNKIAVDTGYGLVESLVLMSYSLFLYIAKTFVPFKQSAITPYPFDAGTMPNYFYFFVIVPVLYLIILLWSWIKKQKIIFFGLAFFIANIFIVLKIKNFIISEHYLYIPSIGLGLILFFYSLKAIKKFPAIKTYIFIALTVYLTFFFIKTIYRNTFFKNSLVFWNDISAKHPNVIVSYYNRGNYLQKLGDNSHDTKEKTDYYKSAIADYDKTIELNPSNVGAYSNRGITLAKLGKYKEAIEDFNKVVDIDSTYGNVYSNRGNAYALLGQWNKAISDYNKALKLKPDFVDALYNRGIALSNIDSNKAAINDFNRVLELNPNKTEVYKQRGIAYYFIKNYDKAIKDLNHYLELYPEDYNAIYYRALSFEKNKKTDLAKKEFERLKAYPQLIKNITKTATNLENIADITHDKKLYDKAMDLFFDILKINPDYSPAYSRIGVLYGKKDNIAKAFEYLNKAIELDSNNAQAFADRGFAYFITNDYKNALKDYNRTLKLNQSDAVTFYNRAILFETTGNYKKAVEDYTNAIKLKPDYAIAIFKRGIILLKFDREAACNDFNKAFSLGIKNAQIYIQKFCKNEQ